jgi:hypothetical protein
MDLIQFVAERRIENALESGMFDGLPASGEIDCSLHGEAFFAWWFRTHYGSQAPANETAAETTPEST